MSVEEATVALDQETKDAIDIDRSVGDFRFPERNKYDAGRGLSSKTIDYICDVKSGGPELALELEEQGYDFLKELAPA